MNERRQWLSRAAAALAVAAVALACAVVPLSAAADDGEDAEGESAVAVAEDESDETLNYTFVDSDGNTVTTTNGSDGVYIYTFTMNDAYMLKESNVTLTTILITTSGTFTLTGNLSANVVVGGDLEGTGQSSDSAIDVTIDLAGYTLTRRQILYDNYANSTTGGYDKTGGYYLKNHGSCSIITVNGEGTTVTLKDSSEAGTGTVTGGYGTNYRNISSTASSDSSAYYGGGVLVMGGTFNLESGTITGNGYDDTYLVATDKGVNNGTSNTWLHGAGVFVYQGGTFNMTGGSVSGNHGYLGGGVWVMDGTFNMSGGTISNNKALCGG